MTTVTTEFKPYDVLRDLAEDLGYGHISIEFLTYLRDYGPAREFEFANDHGHGGHAIRRAFYTIMEDGRKMFAPRSET